MLNPTTVDYLRPEEELPTSSTSSILDAIPSELSHACLTDEHLRKDPDNSELPGDRQEESSLVLPAGLPRALAPAPLPKAYSLNGESRDRIDFWREATARGHKGRRHASLGRPSSSHSAAGLHQGHRLPPARHRLSCDQEDLDSLLPQAGLSADDVVCEVGSIQGANGVSAPGGSFGNEVETPVVTGISRSIRGRVPAFQHSLSLSSCVSTLSGPPSPSQAAASVHRAHAVQRLEVRRSSHSPETLSLSSGRFDGLAELSQSSGRFDGPGGLIWGSQNSGRFDGPGGLYRSSSRSDGAAVQPRSQRKGPGAALLTSAAGNSLQRPIPPVLEAPPKHQGQGMVSVTSQAESPLHRPGPYPGTASAHGTHHSTSVHGGPRCQPDRISDARISILMSQDSLGKAGSPIVKSAGHLERHPVFETPQKQPAGHLERHPVFETPQVKSAGHLERHRSLQDGDVVPEPGRDRPLSFGGPAAFLSSLSPSPSQGNVFHWAAQARMDAKINLSRRTSL